MRFFSGSWKGGDKTRKRRLYFGAWALAVAAWTAPRSTQAVTLSPEDSLETVVAKAAQVRPSPRQIQWQRQEFSGFIHFGMNTFTDREWGDGTEDPKLFNPGSLDTRQWVKAAKAAGITKLILTAKHHDGFCLWPSRFTEHCVRNSPWKNGKGDVVGEFVAACKEEGMHVGIYISPWDRHEKSYGDSPRYNRYFLDQLREVLTGYPGIEELWFDGACAEGPNGKRQVYDWRAYWQLIRKLAPQAAISVRGPDVRWCGNEAGFSRPSEWSVIPMPGEDKSWEDSDKTLGGFLDDIHGEDLGSRNALMAARGSRARLAWYPSQVNTSIRPGWFYHASEDERVKPLSALLDIYFGSVGGNGQFLLNIPPDRRGLFHENDVARLKQLGEVLGRGFSSDLAAGARVGVTVGSGASVGDPSVVLDGDPGTYWTTTDQAQGAVMTVEWPSPVRANCLMLQEHLASGQRIEEFEVEAKVDGAWSLLEHGTVVGAKRLLRFKDATLQAIRIRFTKSRIRPTLATLGVYRLAPVLSGPKVSRDLDGKLDIQAPMGAYARFSLDGSLPTENSRKFSGPIPLVQGGVVTAKSFAMTPGEGVSVDGGLTRVEFGPSKGKWKVVDCDSRDVNARPEYAIDDDPMTFWETKFRDGIDPLPHHIAVDLGEELRITGFTYMPRQDQWASGIIQKARFEVSTNGKEWRSAVEEADFDNVVNSRQQQVVRLKAPLRARFFRLTALRAANDNGQTSVADVSVLTR